jgi:hypothetical protein
MTKANRYMLRGLLVGVLLVAAGVLLLLAVLGFSYRGRCWDVLAVTMTRPCSYREYMTGDVPMTLLLMALGYWWVILLALLLPPAAGYWVGRRRSHGTPQSGI